MQLLLYTNHVFSKKLSFNILKKIRISNESAEKRF